MQEITLKLKAECMRQFQPQTSTGGDFDHLPNQNTTETLHNLSDNNITH
jgi:hypothetical protein